MWIFNGKQGELEATLWSMVHALQFHLKCCSRRNC